MGLNELIETTTLANKLMKEFGLADEGWTFRFSNKKTIMGTCYHGEKVIEFSKWYVESHPNEIEDTIRHEIAHALVGPDHDHDYVWRRKCLEVGARPERCYDSNSPQVTRSVKHNWLLECDNPRCENTTKWKRDRMTRRSRYAICPNCARPLRITDLKTGVSYRSNAKLPTGG